MVSHVTSVTWSGQGAAFWDHSIWFRQTGRHRDRHRSPSHSLVDHTWQPRCPEHVLGPRGEVSDAGDGSSVPFTQRDGGDRETWSHRAAAVGQTDATSASFEHRAAAWLTHRSQRSIAS